MAYRGRLMQRGGGGGPPPPHRSTTRRRGLAWPTTCSSHRTPCLWFTRALSARRTVALFLPDWGRDCDAGSGTPTDWHTLCRTRRRLLWMQTAARPTEQPDALGLRAGATCASATPRVLISSLVCCPA